jgi:hypothetical protein
MTRMASSADKERQIKLVEFAILAFKRLQRQGAFIGKTFPLPLQKPDIFEAKLLGTHRPYLARTPDDEIGVGNPIATMKQGLLVPTLIDEAANEPLTFEILLRLARSSTQSMRSGSLHLLSSPPAGSGRPTVTSPPTAWRRRSVCRSIPIRARSPSCTNG